MLRRSIRILAVAAALALAGPAAFAEEQWPDLLGTWEGHADVIASGNTTHAGNGEAGEPRVVDTKFVIHINHQVGKLFSGTIESNHSDGKLHFAGSFTDGEHTAKIVDKNGTHEFNLIGKNEAKFCFSESYHDGHAIGCGSFRRLLE